MSKCQYLELEIKLANQTDGVIVRPTFEGYSRQDNPEYAVKVEYSANNKSVISGRRIVNRYIPQLFEIKVNGISKQEADALRQIYLDHADSLITNTIVPILVIDRFEPLHILAGRAGTVSQVTTYKTTGTIAIRRDYSRWSAAMTLFELEP